MPRINWQARLIPAVLQSLCAGIFTSSALAAPQLWEHHGNYLKLEVISDKVIHVETAAGSVDKESEIWRSPMVLKDFGLKAPSIVNAESNVIETNALKVVVNDKTLCVNVFNKGKTAPERQVRLASICPFNLGNPWKGLNIVNPDTKHIYGLGQYFTNPGQSDGEWIGRQWDPLSWTEGNALRGFSGGANGYAMFPIMYGLQERKLGQYGLLVDNVYKKMFDFRTHPHSMQTYGDKLRYFFFSGDDLPDLNRTYKQLTGTAPMPPKGALGVWVSEFGFESWEEAQDAVATMHDDKFPVDGLGMDIQWFGGRFFERGEDTRSSRMGSLDFDPTFFPNPKQNIERFKTDFGVELMLIEESYISVFRKEHGTLKSQTLMASYCGTNEPAYLDANPWWGVGGMLDWTNPTTGSYWHLEKRAPLIDMGITYHWTDLGEPEMYSKDACYYGFPELGKHRHSDIHNVYNLRWIESIFKGYAKTHPNKRFYSMSRSGTVGMHRFGGAMWSGDIGANMGALTAHLNTQMHMSLSGMDYYGGDIGGFHRRADTLDGDPNQLFSQWLANSALFDFPVRSHAWNLANNLETAPSEIGDQKSNLFNIHLRYELSPYYYALTRRAYEDGEPVLPPLVYYYQEDPNVWGMGSQKMIGPWMMAGVVASYGQVERDTYLPEGNWYDFHTLDHYSSQGEVVKAVGSFTEDTFRLPLFAKAGAIIPLLHNVSEIRNLKEETWDGNKRRNLFRFRVFAGEKSTLFDYYEDDGVSNDYQREGYRKTPITQKVNDVGEVIKRVVVKVGRAKGRYEPTAGRSLQAEIVYPGTPGKIKVNGSAIAVCNVNSGKTCYEVLKSTQSALVIVRSDLEPGTEEITIEADFDETIIDEHKVLFQCDKGFTKVGQAVFVIGNHPLLGNWDPKDAVKLDPTWYPKWSKAISGFKKGENLEWKCVRRSENGVTELDFGTGGNRTFTVGGKHHQAGTTFGWFQ